jgi:hypothetical protein
MAASPAPVTAEEIALVTNTLNTVMIAMDTGDGNLFASCFTEDGACEIPLTKAPNPTQGTEALVALGAELHAKFPKAKHWEGNICIRRANRGEGGVKKDVLRNTSYWKAMEGGEVVSTGEHDDILINVNGEWKIEYRIISHLWTKARGFISN